MYATVHAPPLAGATALNCPIAGPGARAPGAGAKAPGAGAGAPGAGAGAGIGTPGAVGLQGAYTGR